MNRLRPLPASARSGFTLVELLVVMSLIILLAALAAGISQTGMFGSQKVISAGDRVSGWLLIAKQRAVRDGAPRGVRFFTNPNNTNAYTEAQYIESPEPWVPNPAQEGKPSNARIVFVYNWTANPMTGAFTNFAVKEVYYVSADPADLNEYDQRVNNDDMLALPEFGKSFKVVAANVGGSNITANTYLNTTLLTTANARRVELAPASMPDLSAAGTPLPTSGTVTHTATMVTYKFGFQRTPQPLLGEPTLQLTGGTAIDFRSNTPAPWKSSSDPGSPPPPYNPSTTIGVTPVADPASTTGGQFFDVLFSPSGQLLNTNSGLICLWIRDSSKNVPHPRLADPNTCDPYATYDLAGQQVFVVLNAKNGLISTQEIIPPPGPANPTNYDPYRSAKDGINSGL